MGKRKAEYYQYPSHTRKRSSKSRAARLRRKKQNELKQTQCSSIISEEHDYCRIGIIPQIEEINLPSTSNFQKDSPNFIMQASSSSEQPNCSTSSSTNELNIIGENSTPERIERVQAQQVTPPNEISFISDAEYNSVMQHELHVETDNSLNNKNCVISGNRVVDLQYVLNWSLTLQNDHSKICTSGKIYLVKEIRWGTGLASSLVFSCTMCKRQYTFYTEDPNKKSKLNYGFVWGTLASGSTYSHVEELFCAMDIPPMTLYMFKKIEGELGDVWKDSLMRNMEKAGHEERQIAIDNGDIDDDGVPFITVHLDGGWSKRSYGHSYNAASGADFVSLQ